MRVKPLQHIHQVKVSYMVMAQLLVLHIYHLHFTQTQAIQQTLKSLEIQPVLLAVALEELLDVEALLLLWSVPVRTLGLWGQSGSSHVGSLRNLQVAVGLVVVGMVMSTVMMVVPFSMAVVALMEEEGEHTQETELGVHVDSHCPLTSGPLQKQESNRISNSGHHLECFTGGFM